MTSILYFVVLNHFKEQQQSLFIKGKDQASPAQELVQAECVRCPWLLA
jgi:hypothetical protein